MAHEVIIQTEAASWIFGSSTDDGYVSVSIPHGVTIGPPMISHPNGMAIAMTNLETPNNYLKFCRQRLRDPSRLQLSRVWGLTNTTRSRKCAKNSAFLSPWKGAIYGGH